MSIQYHKDIFSNEHLTLKVNFYGLNEDVATSDDLSMSIYAYSSSGQPIFSETLNFDQIKTLYDHLSQISIIKNSSSQVSGKFVESTAEISDLINKFTRVDPSLLEIVLSKIKEHDKINSLLLFLSEGEINTLTTLQRHRDWQGEIEILKTLLTFEESGNIVAEVNKDDRLSYYKAGQPEKIFQNWIEKNYSWIFGVQYIKKHNARKIALYSEGDMLMESMDGFLDLIELKRPSHDIFASIDASHKSYYPSLDLSKVIGQSLYYLQKMEDLKLVLEKEYKVKIIRPRIKIIIGRTKDFKEEQYSALRMLNCQLNNLEIISYDTLVKYGERMISHLED